MFSKDEFSRKEAAWIALHMEKVFQESQWKIGQGALAAPEIL